LSCDETPDLIHGYLDGELDIVKSMEVEKHLRDCNTCTQSHQAIRSVRSVAGQSGVRFEPSVDLEKRLRSALRRENEPERKSFLIRWRWPVAATSLIIVIGLAWGIVQILTRKSESDLLAQEIVSSHVRSLMADHLTDVPSSNQHTVKPWFEGKLDFSPPVKDLSQQGFSLIGGRLDYIGHRSVAALVYQRGQHSINVFIWPSADAEAMNERTSANNGYNVVRWSNGGMAYWVVSDLNPDELRQFVTVFNDRDKSPM
jgi:anti-sigma factor RsiW